MSAEQHHPARPGAARVRAGRGAASAGLARGRAIWPPVSLALLAAAAVVAAVADDDLGRRPGRDHASWSRSPGCSPCVGGGPVTTRIFAFVDAPRSRRRARRRAADRARPARCCAAAPGSAPSSGWRSSPASRPGFPEGVAVVLALKGVGRFPDLRDDQGRERRHRAVHHRHLHQRALGRRLRRDGGAGAAMTGPRARASERCERSERAPRSARGATRSPRAERASCRPKLAGYQPGPTTARISGCRRPAATAHLVEGDRRRSGPSPRRCRAARRGPARPCRCRDIREPESSSPSTSPPRSWPLPRTSSSSVMPCAATRDSSVRTTASTSSSLLGRQPDRDPDQAGVGVVAGEREDRVGQAAALADLLEQPATTYRRRGRC